MAKLYFRDFPSKISKEDIKAGKPEVAQSNWECAPISLCRDSDPLEQANFDAFVDLLDKADPYAAAWEIIYFDHFAVGWTGHVFINPASAPLIKLADEARAQLAKYPCLNEDLWVEYAAAAETKGK